MHSPWKVEVATGTRHPTGAGAPEWIRAVGVFEIIESVELAGLLAGHLVINEHRHHMSHVIGLSERSCQLRWPKPNVVHCKGGRAVPGPLHQLDQRHALGDAGKDGHSRSPSSVASNRSSAVKGGQASLSA